MFTYAALAFSILAVLLQGCIATPDQIDSEFPTFENRVETWSGKTVMVVTPHPDDDTFGCGGILAILAANGNEIIIMIYTNDDKGSRDPDMTSERLARIRKQEEENACAILGIPKENIVWLGLGDGMLEYVDRRELTQQVAREIRKYRPDALFSIDPGDNLKRCYACVVEGGWLEEQELALVDAWLEDLAGC